MLNFLIILFSIFGLTSLGWAAESVEEQRAAAFDADASWSDMHNYAETRSKWFRDTIKELTDETADLSKRVKLAKKIDPRADESKVSVSRGLSGAKQKELQCKKLLNSFVSDIVYSFLYWDFLERVFQFYNTHPNNTPEIRNAVLPKKCCSSSPLKRAH